MKKIVRGFGSTIIALGLLSGLPITNNIAIVSAETVKKDEPTNEFRIKEEVKGNNLYVECVISNFTFSDRNDKGKGQGYIKLYLNDKKIDDLYTASFIVKGLPKGNHSLTVKLVNNNGEPIGKEKTIDITIEE